MTTTRRGARRHTRRDAWRVLLAFGLLALPQVGNAIPPRIETGSSLAPRHTVAADDAPEPLPDAPPAPPARSFPWIRTGLALACGLLAVDSEDSYGRAGWLILGAGLASWAVYDATTSGEPSLASAGGVRLVISGQF
ncbi:MAG: hypothetical protein RIT45_3340 [Pseudomonadota bacterium]